MWFLSPAGGCEVKAGKSHGTRSQHCLTCRVLGAQDPLLGYVWTLSQGQPTPDLLLRPQ